MRTSRASLVLAVPAAALFALAEGRAAEKGVTVSLCDGDSVMTLPGLAPGEELAPADARRVAGEMMQVWRTRAGEPRWASWAAEAALAPVKPEPRSAAPAAGAQEGQPLKFTARDQMLWKREQDKWIAEGYAAFHNAKTLGGTIGISCDMCHPDATNTHPETYPKFQTQTKKMALLRDMINWCIENPMKGKPLPEDDPRLRAVEAYIYSARKGVALEPGKH
jgi:hypothetical protein